MSSLLILLLASRLNIMVSMLHVIGELQKAAPATNNVDDAMVHVPKQCFLHLGGVPEKGNRSFAGQAPILEYNLGEL